MEVTIVITGDHIVGILASLGGIFAALLPFLRSKPDPLRETVKQHEERLTSLEEWRKS